MIKSYTTALVATLAAAASKDASLLQHLTELEGRQLSVSHSSSVAPNANIANEAACSALNAATSSAYYFYDWNVDGCYCSHMWKKTHQYYDYYSWCATGYVLNPRHIPGYQPDRCIPQEDFAANKDYAACPQPEPTCEDNFVAHAGAPSKGYASAVLKGNGAAAEGLYSSGFEIGFVIFEEMCGGVCAPLNSTGGSDSPSCDGICVSGNFWGLNYAEDMPIESGLHIHEFAAACASLPSGCTQTGAVHPFGSLGNVAHASEGRCNASGFAYCAQIGQFALSGPDSIVGKSVVLHSMPDLGSDAAAELSESPANACGTITQDHLNPAMNLIPFGATAEGDDEEQGLPCPGSGAPPIPVLKCSGLDQAMCNMRTDCTWGKLDFIDQCFKP